VFPITFSAVLTANTDSINAICNDQTYWNLHTTQYASGEVRANVVGMHAICNIDKYDGTLTVFGAEPTTGLLVKDFCVSTVGVASKGTGNCDLTACWSQVDSTLIFSGVCYGFTSEVYQIYVYFEDDNSYSFLTIASSYFEYDTPFSFPVDNIDEFELAKILSKRAYITIGSYNGAEDIRIDLSDFDFPKSASLCVPYVLELPTDPLTCYVGSSTYSDLLTKVEAPAKYLCSVYQYSDYESYSYNSYSNCYICTCDADLDTAMPAGGYSCCGESLCNDKEGNDLYCDPTGAGSMLSAGLMVALISALISIWFN
jgi:hypothetical protein